MINSKLKNDSASKRSPLADFDKARLFQSLQMSEKKKINIVSWSLNLYHWFNIFALAATRE